MKAKTRKPTHVNVVTLGCSKNLFDSEVLMGQLKANGIQTTHESDSVSEVVVINTCGFIDKAKEESIQTILRYCQAKQDQLVDKVYVTGCLSERYSGDLATEIPEVDAWFGTRDLPRLLKTLKANYKHELVGERLLTTPTHYAYLKISEGCDRPCSFCAIPLMRGKHRSTPIEDLVNQAQGLAANGTKELLLIAQDSTYYGLDLYGKRNLAELMTRLADVDGIDWLRLHYAFPTGFPEDVIEAMHQHPNICSYLDIPLQHASNPMLKSMRRGTTREKTERLLNQLRQGVPGITLRTTMIVGYPGETQADFDELCDFVQQQRFDRLGVFTYSHEENTHAFALKDDVPQEVKEERASKLMSIQQEISGSIQAEKIGSIQKILIDKKEGDYYIGRTEADSPEVDCEVLIPASEGYLRIGDFVTAKIVDSEDYDLFASLDLG
ncbi:MAG: 30S ribosomal protein S12 methylthiotransferase RimO [Bacteroidetes bacterium]|nr:30S ribosomal protein S12 methylthiotransferase RimO [Bacteroidota bacterium]